MSHLSDDDEACLSLNRRSFLKSAAAVGLTGAVVTGLSSVMPLRAFAADGTATGTLTFGNAEPPTANYWDPAAGFGLADEQVASLVHDTLIGWDENGKLVPSIATAWEIKNPTTVALAIRTDVKFHTGKPLTVDDIKASIDRLGLGKLAQSMVVTPGVVVNIISPTSIEVVSPVPFGVALNALAFVKILPKANIDNPDSFKTGAIGSGPYKFVSYTNNNVTLEANTDYWGGVPKIKMVVLSYIEDNQARINALLDGEVDILSRCSPEDLSRVEGNNQFTTATVSPPSQVLAIYQHNGPLKDVRLRWAIAYAIDRQAIAKSLMRGKNPVGYSSLPTNVPFYVALEPKFAPDLEKAAALVKAAYPDGVTLRMSTSTLVPDQIEIDQVIAGTLQQIGITMNVERLEVGAFRTSYNTYDINLNSLSSFNNDPDFLLGFYTGAVGEAVFHFKDDKYDVLYAAQRAAGPGTRAAAVTAAAQYLWENQAALYLSDQVWYFIVNKRVHNYKRAPVVGENLVPQASIAV